MGARARTRESETTHPRTVECVRFFFPYDDFRERWTRGTEASTSASTSTTCGVFGTHHAHADRRGVATVDVIGWTLDCFKGESTSDSTATRVGALRLDDDVCFDEETVRRTMERHGAGVWVTVNVGRDWRAPPTAFAVVKTEDGAVRVGVKIILCPMPDPPLMIMTLNGSRLEGVEAEPGTVSCPFERSLQSLNGAGRAWNGAAERRSLGAGAMVTSILGSAVGSVEPMIDVALRVMDYKCIKSLGAEARWGANFTTRNVCEIFASPCVLRTRLELIRKLFITPIKTAKRMNRLQRRRFVAQAVQLTIDILLGACVAHALNAEDARAKIERAFIEGFESNQLLGSRLIEANARWISKGDPLGVKLHIPLARFLGSMATTLVQQLSLSLSSAPVLRLQVSIISSLIRYGGVFGASMVFAIAADTMTIFTMHISALHVYSSLFITVQLRCIRLLYRRFINPKAPPKGFKASEEEMRPRTVEEVVIGTLTLPPLVLLFPTVFFFYISYLVIHASTVIVRLAMVFIASFLLTFPTDDVLIRLWTPYAYPKSVDVLTRDVNGADFTFATPIAKTYDEVLRAFTRTAQNWLAAVALAIGRACVTCGRFPITLVPFTHISDS